MQGKVTQTSRELSPRGGRPRGQPLPLHLSSFLRATQHSTDSLGVGGRLGLRGTVGSAFSPRLTVPMSKQQLHPHSSPLKKTP